MSWTGPEEILDLWKTKIFKETEIFVNAVEVVMRSKGPDREAAFASLCYLGHEVCGICGRLGDSPGCKNTRVCSTEGLHKSCNNEFQGLFRIIHLQTDNQQTSQRRPKTGKIQDA